MPANALDRAPSPPLASTEEELSGVLSALRGYRRLPFAGDNIPGAYVEAVVARVRHGRVLRTYDFVDVINQEKRIGWQVKSTMSDTPVTWKRAKIPNALDLIAASRSSAANDLQALGDAIIEFCNAHARASLDRYDLDAIGYARVYVTRSEIVYFERELVTRERPQLFDPTDFAWQWSVPRATVKKEQLQALRGIRVDTGKKWFAWHGLGENQLHFAGEDEWWPGIGSPNRITTPLPDDDTKISFEAFVEWVAAQERMMPDAEK